MYVIAQIKTRKTYRETYTTAVIVLSVLSLEEWVSNLGYLTLLNTLVGGASSDQLSYKPAP